MHDEAQEEITQIAAKIQTKLAELHPTMSARVLNSDEKVEMSVKKAAGEGHKYF